MTSALEGIVQRMREAGIDRAAVDEIDRVLGLLRNQGWSGFITADEALVMLIRRAEMSRAEQS